MLCGTRRTVIRYKNANAMICHVDENLAFVAAHAVHYVNNCHAMSASESDNVSSNSLATGYISHSAFLIFSLQVILSFNYLQILLPCRLLK